MNSNQLQNKLAVLESKLDFLETEFEDLDSLLKKSGFKGGVRTLKLAVIELLKSKGSLGFL